MSAEPMSRQTLRAYFGSYRRGLRKAVLGVLKGYTNVCTIFCVYEDKKVWTEKFLNNSHCENEASQSTSLVFIIS